MKHPTKVVVPADLDRWIREEAKRHKRGIKGQVELMLEMAQKEIQREANDSTIVTVGART